VAAPAPGPGDGAGHARSSTATPARGSIPRKDLASARDWIAAREARRIAQEAERNRRPRPPTGTPSPSPPISTAPIRLLCLSQGGEGVGLMRTEFLFLERGTPDEDEQFAIYRAMIEALGDRPLIVRALDIGGDKQVPHLDLPMRKTLPRRARRATAAAPSGPARSACARSIARRHWAGTCRSCSR
jgi:hypothetical protein